MQLITMDVEETLEQKTLPNGLVDNAKTEETANRLSQITDKEEANNASIEIPKSLEPVQQPDGENSKPMENIKESVVNEDATEVNSSDMDTAILNEKQNGSSAAKNQDAESSKSEQDIKINNEDTCNDSVEDKKEINTQPTQATEESVAEATEKSVAQATEESVAEAREESVAEATEESVAEAIEESVAEAREESVAEARKESVAEATEESVAEAIEESVAKATEESVAEATELSVTEATEVSVDEAREESVAEASEESVAEVSELFSRDVQLEPIACEDNKEDLSSASPGNESEASSIPEVKALTNSSEVTNVTNDTIDSNADKTAKTNIASKDEENSVTSEGTPMTDEILFEETDDIVEQVDTGHADTDIIDAGSTESSKENNVETKPIKDFKEECSLEDLNAKETATLTVDEIGLKVNNDVDIEKEDAMETASTISEEAKNSDITKENSKNSDINKDETIDIGTSISNKAAENIEKLSDSIDGCAMETDTLICNNIEPVDTLENLSDSSNEYAMETDSTIYNKLETQDIIVPDIENAMDTATTNNDETRTTEATQEGDKKYISIVDEAMVIESTIDDKISEIKTAEKSEILILPKDDINMDTKTVENDSIDLKNKSSNVVPKDHRNSDENLIETVNTKNESVENIENIDEDIEEELLASPSHQTDLTDEDGIERTEDMSLQNVNLDSSDCGQMKNPSIDITEDSPENDSPAIVIDGDKTDTNSETKGKGNDGIEIKDKKTVQAVGEKAKTRNVCGLSNTLDILSDDDDDDNAADINDKVQPPTEPDNKCIDIDDDDDVMLIEEDYSSKGSKSDEPTVTELNEKSEEDEVKQDDDSATTEESKDKASSQLEPELPDKTDEVIDIPEDMETEKIDISEKPIESEIIPKVQEKKTIVPPNFLKTFKTNVEKMTREELEEFCLLKIVEAVVDRTNLGDIKARLKTMYQQMEAWKKKSAGLSKQNRDLQIVLKTVQEEQKKKTDGPITPLRITRSVGMQVYMAENLAFQNKKKSHPPRVAKYQTPPTPKQAKPNSPQIPVPRLVPAINNSPAKNIRQSPVQNSTVSSNSVKTVSPMANGLKNSPATKPVEKRPFSSIQAVTVDLTDDEPPPKVAATARNPPATVRMVPQNQLMARPQFNQNNNSPRKVFIPINTPNQPVIRPGQTLMLKSVPPPGPRHRAAAPMVRIPQNPGPRAPRLGSVPRHPAPLPDVPKQQQPPNWKSLPPAPDLKISKVENGIVISWKIDGFTVVNFEEIASYQLYAYQETSAPPNTMLWKKIGDVKALPLPMACTLTQFMAGYKYYFAVRAVDVRSRIGPFSLPGSILLLNK